MSFRGSSASPKTFPEPFRIRPAIWGEGLPRQGELTVVRGHGSYRPNSRASCVWLRWIIVGRPCGQVCRKSQRESCSIREAISVMVRESPARTALWHATAHRVWSSIGPSPYSRSMRASRRSARARARPRLATDRGTARKSHVSVPVPVPNGSSSYPNDFRNSPFVRSQVDWLGVNSIGSGFRSGWTSTSAEVGARFSCS